MGALMPRPECRGPSTPTRSQASTRTSGRTCSTALKGVLRRRLWNLRARRLQAVAVLAGHKCRKGAPTTKALVSTLLSAHPRYSPGVPHGWRGQEAERDSVHERQRADVEEEDDVRRNEVRDCIERQSRDRCARPGRRYSMEVLVQKWANDTAWCECEPAMSDSTPHGHRWSMQQLR